MDKRAELIEAMARAMCIADGYDDPDEHIQGGQAQAFFNYGSRWQAAKAGAQGITDYVALAEAALDIALKAAAGIAGGWKSSLRPGSQDRLSGHLEARRDIADAILALTSKGEQP